MPLSQDQGDNAMVTAQKKGGLRIVTDPTEVMKFLIRAIEDGGGVLLFACAAIVQRIFCAVGEPFGLKPGRVFPYGPFLGQADETWLASWKRALNGEKGCPDDEGISYLVGIDDDGQKVAIPFDVALGVIGQTLVGLARVLGWPYAKIFSNLLDIPNHFHLTAADAKAVGLEGSKWESYLLLVQFMQRILRSPRQFPAGVYEDVGPDQVAPYMLDKNWGQPDWDARALSPAHLVKPGDAAHMPPGVPHAPTGNTPFFELMEPQDHFVMISGFQDATVTPSDLRWRHMLDEQKGWTDQKKAEFVANRIDYDAARKPFRSTNMLKQIADGKNNGNGVSAGATLKWGIYGMLGGEERYSAKLWHLRDGAELKFTGPACVLWVLDGSVTFGKQRLAHSREYDLDDPLFDLALKTDMAEAVLKNNGPAHASGVVWFGPDSHGDQMPKYPGQLVAAV